MIISNFMTKISLQEETELSGKAFSQVPEIYAYVPQAHVPGLLYPQLICEIDRNQWEFVGWVDPNNRDYRQHNMIYDVKKRGRGAFSTITSWSQN